jgi:hypothetical protein
MSFSQKKILIILQSASGFFFFFGILQVVLVVSVVWFCSELQVVGIRVERQTSKSLLNAVSFSHAEQNCLAIVEGPRAAAYVLR